MSLQLIVTNPEVHRVPAGDQPRAPGVVGSTRPASTLVEVPRLAVDGAKVEIECIALVP